MKRSYFLPVLLVAMAFPVAALAASGFDDSPSAGISDALVAPGGPMQQPVVRFQRTMAVAVKRIHVRHRAEAARASVLEGVDAVRTALLRAVSHDLRTPLAAIKAFISGLRQHDVQWTPDELNEMYAGIESETDRLDALSRRFMAETLGGFLARDYRRVAQIHLQVGFVPPRHSVDDFAQALRAIGEPIFGRPASNMSMARLLTQLFEVTRLFDMEMQPQLAMLQKTMVVVEGVARQLDPNHSIWESAKPVVEQWMIDQVGPQARLNQAAEGMSTLGRAIAALPEVLKNAEQAAATLTTNGLRLHPDSTEAIARAQSARTQHVRIAIWIGAIALATLAIAQL